VKRTKGANVVWFLLAVFAVVAAWLAWKTLFPSEEQRIRARLDEIVDTVNAPSADGLAKLADAARLVSFFTEDVTIDPGVPYPTMRGRDAIVAAAAAAGRAAGGFELSFVDVQVAVGDGGDTATAHLTVTLTWTNVQSGAPTMDAREVELALRKEAGEWRVAGATPVETLERPRP
jgi:ketosteroid isomerase-like protein